MRSRWPWPAWVAAVAGLAATAAMSVTLRVGSGALLRGLSVTEQAEIGEGVALLILTGLVVATAVVAYRVHPLLPGIPALWFTIVYIPAMFMPWPADWLPEWISSHFLLTASAAPFVITGVLLGATAASVLGWAPAARNSPPEEVL